MTFPFPKIFIFPRRSSSPCLSLLFHQIAAARGPQEKCNIRWVSALSSLPSISHSLFISTSSPLHHLSLPRPSIIPPFFPCYIEKKTQEQKELLGLKSEEPKKVIFLRFHSSLALNYGF
ncbi:hypothetical protein KY285_035339 [Solanum tuberosum]|nr:hypothetical protein KY285_035339 [Solanum tuberosum]